MEVFKQRRSSQPVVVAPSGVSREAHGGAGAEVDAGKREVQVHDHAHQQCAVADKHDRTGDFEALLARVTPDILIEVTNDRVKFGEPSINRENG